MDGDGWCVCGGGLAVWWGDGLVGIDAKSKVLAATLRQHLSLV